MQILIGADPEVFVKKKGSDLFDSAHGLIPGTKEAPHKVDKGAVQVDGMALEFNIDPASTEDEFVENIQSVMKTLEGMVPDHDVVVESTATFPQEVIDNSPEEALELGCEPDLNAYTGAENPRPETPEGDFFRTAAGHIHIGWTEDQDVDDPDHLEACAMLCRQLDFYVGAGSRFFDKDQKRRELYGKAGAYRVKSYGMEYRTLSNAWLLNEDFMRWVYRACIKAFEDLVEGKNSFNEAGMYGRGMVDKPDWGPNSEAFHEVVLKDFAGLEVPKVAEA